VWSRVHFPEAELRLLNDLAPEMIDIAVDVGAALGPYSWILNRKARQVFAFEPGEVHGYYLELNFAGTKVTVVKAAVGDVTKTVEMFTAGADTNALHMATLSKSNPISHQNDVSVREVQQVKLDDYFADKVGPGRSVDLLKVDVEGYETEVFKGAEAFLRKYCPLIICEIEVRLNPDYAQTFKVVRSLGYISYLYLDGRYQEFKGVDIAPYQTEEALKVRLSDQYVPSQNKYLNNFVFQHPNSRLKVA
jgi:FkbM family methyltransferase